ncbi:MAG: hypothetical protein OXT09_20720, partial [Myxococcales bacterium]|nr:hypothetical protein [Myxococcales bacterium]
VTPTAPPPTNPGPECVEHPGLGVFPPECAGCLCSVDASRVLACNLDCLGLIECVVSRCGSDGTDITCITAECVDFVHEATAATELGDVLLGSCDPVCRTETVPDGCIVAIPLELDDGADGGVDCTAPIPDGVDPAVATPELAELTLDQGFGPDRLARVDGFDACGNQDAWFVPQDSMAPALELCPVSCARVSQGAIAAARFPCAAPLD